MTIFTEVYNWISRVWGGAKKHHPEFMKALEEWIDQFSGEAGSLAINLALEYAPKLSSGEITIVAAKDEILAKLAKEGTIAGKELVELILNALRTYSVSK